MAGEATARRRPTRGELLAPAVLVVAFPGPLAAAWIWDDLPFAAVALALVASLVLATPPMDRFEEARSLVFRGLFFGTALQASDVVFGDDDFKVASALLVGALFALMSYAFDRAIEYHSRKKSSVASPEPPA